MPSPSPPPLWPGAESDGRRQRSQMRSPDLAQPHQHRLCPEHLPHRAQTRLTSQLPGHQRHQRQQRHPHIPHPPPHPSHRPGQLDVWPDLSRRLLDARTRRHFRKGGGHHLLDRVEAPSQPTRQAVGQQAEGGVSRRTVPACDLRPGWLDSRVRPVPLKPTAPVRMQRASIQACLLPTFLPNVVLAGKRRLVAQLHTGHWPARRQPWRASISVYGCSCGQAPCPSPAPASPTPRFPQSPHVPPSRNLPPSHVNQRWPTPLCNRRWITRLREGQHHWWPST